MPKRKYQVDEGLSSEETKIQQLVLDQLEKEEEELIAKDNAGLTDEGSRIWIAMKTIYSLEWDGKYCLPTSGILEEKAKKLNNIMKDLDRYDNHQLKQLIVEDRRVILERLESSLEFCRDPHKRATDEDETPADESTPIPEDAKLKIQTEFPLDKLEKMFAAMVRQGWVAQGAERLVLQRFTNFVLKEPVPPGTPMFDWLDASAKLRRLKQDLDWPNARMPDHFLLKGKSLNPETLRTGGKTTDDKHLAAVRELTKIYLP